MIKGKNQNEESKNKEEKKEHAKEEILVRISSTDIPGNKRVYVGLSKIKGISWGMSNAICNILKIDKKRRIKDLSKEEIENIISLVKSPNIPVFLVNRRKDIETGENKHLLGTDLDLTKEFDIKRLKKIKSYRGIRHSAGKPVRGQRTRANFRKNKTVGVKKKSKK